MNEDNESLLKQDASFSNVDEGRLQFAELPFGAATATTDGALKGVVTSGGGEADEDREEEDSMFTSYRISYCSDSDDAEEEDAFDCDEDGPRYSTGCPFSGEAEDVARLNAKYR